MPVESDLKKARFVWDRRFRNFRLLFLWACDDSGASHTRTGQGKAVGSRGAMKHIERVHEPEMLTKECSLKLSFSSWVPMSSFHTVIISSKY